MQECLCFVVFYRRVPVSEGVKGDSVYVWVDWLGATNGSSQYKVTAMDTQGNESDALNGVTSVHQQSPATAAGQYTITWTGLYGSIAPPESSEPGGGDISTKTINVILVE